MSESKPQTEEFLLTDERKETLIDLLFGHYILEEREVRYFTEVMGCYGWSNYRGGTCALAKIQRRIDRARTMYDLSDAVPRIRGSIHIAAAAGLYGADWRARIRDILHFLYMFERQCHSDVGNDTAGATAYVGIVNLDKACGLELDVAGKPLYQIRDIFSDEIAQMKKKGRHINDTDGGQSSECE